LVQNGKTFELFTVEEQIHFKDVKDLIWLDYKFLIVSLIVLLAYCILMFLKRSRPLLRSLAKGTLWGCGIAVLLVMILGAASFLDFDQLFLQFHYLVFTNQYWSAQGYMLLLFPGDFWFDAAIFCVSLMLLLSGILAAAAIIYLRASRDKS
jgi:integral membrane protein (TIGR01906 family)